MKPFALAAILVLAASVGAGAAQAPARAVFAVADSTPIPERPSPPSSAPPTGLDRNGLDIDAVEKYDEAVKFEQGDDDPADKAQTWRSLGADVSALADATEKRAQDWDRYARSAQAYEDAARARLAARDADWDKLSALLSGTAAAKTDKRAWTVEFFKAYANSPGIEPVMARDLLPFAAPGAMKDALRKTASRGPRPAAPSPTGAAAPAAR